VSGTPVDLGTLHDVQAWLYDEAELLDARRWREWLALLADDVRYRMPVTVTVDRRSAGTTVGGAMVHLDEDRYSLEKRVERLEGGHAWTEDPPSRTRRFVTNVRAHVAGSGELDVDSYVLLYRSRADDRPAEVLSAARRDLLRAAGRGWLLARREITVDDAVLRMQNLALFL
jgi:3-phenylpropionate/cinnamic acid dioxygenase small subunit